MLVKSVVLVVVLCLALDVHGHGYLSKPASRNAKHGGGNKQSLSAGGPAFESANGHGLCGSRIDNKIWEAPGPYVENPTVTYTAGQWVNFESIITAHHWGWIELRLCVLQPGSTLDTPITQDCLNQHVLEFDLEFTMNQYNGQMATGVSSPADYMGTPPLDYRTRNTRCFPGREQPSPDGSCCNNGGACSPADANRHRWVLPDPSAKQPYVLRYKIPEGISCERCVLQWYYQTGNSPDGYPEGFWNCADIKIVSGSPSPPTNFRTPAPVTAPPTNVRTPAPVTNGGSLCKSLKSCIADTVCADCNSVLIEKGICSATTNPPVTNPTNNNQQCVTVWGKCAGQGFTAPGPCCEGLRCDFQSQWYSQCIPEI